MITRFLKNMRKEAGLRQVDVAAWIGSERSNYVRKEKGETPITVDELNIIINNYKRYLRPEKLTKAVLCLFEIDRQWKPEPVKQEEKMELALKFIEHLQDQISKLESDLKKSNKDK